MVRLFFNTVFLFSLFAVIFLHSNVPLANATETTYTLSEMWVGSGTAHGQFNFPIDVFIDTDDRVLVADYINGRIQIFNQNSQVQEVWTGFNGPEKIAQDTVGDFYIADTNNRRVVKLDKHGNNISNWRTGDYDSYFPRGVGIAVSNDNFVYVVNAVDHVYKYDRFGQLVTSWGNNGAVFVKGILEAVRVDSKGIVYVLADQKVVKLSPKGDLLSEWKSPGGSQDIFIDSNDNVFIADTSNNRVAKYTPDGQLLTIFGEGILNAPHGTGVDRRGRVYVADARNNRIVVFTPSAPPPFTLDAPLIKQTDARWANMGYDHSKDHALNCGKTIGECGCALTSLAMILNYHGVYKDPQGNATSPATLNNYFNQNAQCGSSGCISQGYVFGDVLWSAADRYSADANKNFGTQKIVSLNSASDTVWNPEKVSQDIKNGNPVVIQTQTNEHWVLARGVDQGTFVINDPLNNVDRLSQSPHRNTAYAMHRFKKTSSDFSALEMSTKLPGKISITDPLGRAMEAIPNMHVSVGNRQATNTVTIGTPIAGEYTVTVTSSTSIVPLAVYALNINGGLKIKLFEQKNPFMENRSFEYKFIYDPISENNQLKLRLAIDIQPYIKNNVGFCSNSSLMVPVAVLSTDTFNTHNIDDKTVTFEGARNTFKNPVTKQPFHLTQDVNRDGKQDAIFNFSLNKTTLSCISTKGTLSGKLKDGMDFEGSDNIHMINKAQRGK